MPHRCVAFACNSNSDIHDVSFHRFPLHRKHAREWERAIRRKNWKSSKYSKLCSRHFKPEDYQKRPGAEKPRLKDTAVPSIFDFPPKLQAKLDKRKRKIELLMKVVQLMNEKVAESDSAVSNVEEDPHLVQDDEHELVPQAFDEEPEDITGGPTEAEPLVELPSVEELTLEIDNMKKNLSHCYWEIDYLKSIIRSLVRKPNKVRFPKPPTQNQ